MIAKVMFWLAQAHALALTGQFKEAAPKPIGVPPANLALHTPLSCDKRISGTCMDGETPKRTTKELKQHLPAKITPALDSSASRQG